MQLSIVSVIVEPEEGEVRGLGGKAVVELGGVGGVLKNGMSKTSLSLGVAGEEGMELRLHKLLIRIL